MWGRLRNSTRHPTSLEPLGGDVVLYCCCNSSRGRCGAAFQRSMPSISFFFFFCSLHFCSLFIFFLFFFSTSRRRGAAAPHLDDDNHAELLFILGLFVKYSDCNLFFLIDVDIDVDGGGEIDGTCPSNTD